MVITLSLQPVGLLTVIAGKGLMVTVVVVVLTHPLASVPVTVYVVVVVVVVVTLVPVPLLRLPAGLQVYTLAPEALMLPLLPEQMPAPVAVTVGLGLTVTRAVAVLVHPLASLPVTV